jgi:hypothetical protein
MKENYNNYELPGFENERKGDLPPAEADAGTTPTL